jgi:hypothetical protein
MVAELRFMVDAQSFIVEGLQWMGEALGGVDEA